MKSSKYEHVRKIRKENHCLSIMIIFAFILLLPSLSYSCPMCQGGEGFSKNSIFAYKLTTAFLASLPLLMGGGIFWWVRKKLKSVE